MNRIAVLTSGGDAPGMNAAIRAVVRIGREHGLETWGVQDGFAGLCQGRFEELDRRDVGGIVDRSGTMLGSSRYPAFCDESEQRRAREQMDARDVDGLVVIGGNGSQSGAAALAGRGMRVVGVASTIDNDLWGTDITIGFDSAVSVATQAVDRLRTTATSHHRVFVVQVMGRDCGSIAVSSAIAGGAEACVIPETVHDTATIVADVCDAYRQKGHAIVVVAEGSEPDGAALVSAIRAQRADHDLPDLQVRLTILGHTQRGGSPTVSDRLLGSRLGGGAVRALIDGRHGVLVGIQDGGLSETPLASVVGKTRAPDPALLRMAEALAR